MERKIDEQGFSLMEVLISITILASVSIFILQMFIVAADGNQRAQDQDFAFSYVSELIEEIKSHNSVEETYDYFSTFEQKGENFVITLNNNWEEDDIVGEAVKDDTANTFTVEISPQEKESKAGTLLKCTIKVTSQEPEKTRVLYEITSDKYFPRGDINEKE